MRALVVLGVGEMFEELGRTPPAFGGVRDDGGGGLSAGGKRLLAVGMTIQVKKCGGPRARLIQSTPHQPSGVRSAMRPRNKIAALFRAWMANRKGWSARKMGTWAGS